VTLGRRVTGEMAMDEIEAMKIISDKLEKLSDEERSRVLAWAASKYGGFSPKLGQLQLHPVPPVPDGAKKANKTAAKSKSGKRAKTIISMDKSLNLTPSGKPSAMQFAAEKAPSNTYHKGVVAVYYLRDFVGLDKATVSAVYTFFKTVNWPVPADLKNTLQKAGSDGLLDTANAEDIKLTSMGENLVEHKLPQK
jgi:hypothetical protein